MDNILYEGKSKIICRGTEENNYIIRYKDTATAFNGEKKEELSGKGVLNAKISNMIFDYLAKNDIHTHLIEVIDDAAILAKKAEIIMVEVIIRNIAAGSLCKKYGIKEGSELNNIIVEYSLKSDELGDPLINEDQITALGITTMETLEEMKRQALIINELLCDLFKKAGILLVDFKLEFGICDGEIILCDEISPDGCRLWDMETMKKMDKDRFRQDLGEVLDGYEEVLRRIGSVLA